MTKQDTTSQKPYYVPSAIQRLCIGGIAGLYLAQTIFIMYVTFSNVQGNIGEQLGYLAIYNLVPILLFLIAYVLNPRPLARLSKTFESLLIAVGAYMAWSFVNMILPYLLLKGAAIPYKTYEYVATLSFLTLYAAVLYVLRKKGSWA